MAHENLKFKLHLDDYQEWQPILGSQDFGTFYMVYIKFEKYENEENQFGVDEHRYTCKFRIQNFKGPVTIGFVGKPTIGHADKIKTDDDIHVYIDIQLGCFVYNEYSENTIKLDKPIPRNRPLMTRYTMRLPDSVTMMDTKQEFYNANDPMKSPFLYPYKYERDGDGAFELGRRPFDSNGDFETIPNPDQGGGGPYGICSPNTSWTI
ncbi:hypothetical protein [Altibacter sp. HG106]|uniref:hypothetical protein n=1 Tax=Altibacter sp. HG106 TaxID=3023937 RepID=UPI00235100CD|nr:hypothetical protein [Altibacter sp. HG106]MDC7995774.1 hypothetical protein [Altibacter sp. HG106]